jgi:putative ABC transport system ATP-binding protein
MDKNQEFPVSIRDLSYAYRDAFAEHQILKDVDLDIGSGEIVIVTGPSGSGKTTLITIIGALRAAQAGSVKIFGQDLVGAPQRGLVAIRKKVGYIFQQHNLLDYMTVGQNIMMSLQLGAGSVKRSVAREKISGVLAQVGLEDHINKRPPELSGGQKQRVGIARALVNEPRLILADEPTASLDKEAGRNVVNLIQDLARQQGSTVILVTHDNRILDVADRILHLEDGVIQSIGEAVASSTSRMLRLLERHDPATSHYLSALSLGLTRVAMADDEIDESERAAIRSALSSTSHLSAAEVDLVMELAFSQLRLRSGGGATVESAFNEEQSRHFIDSLRAVASADGAIRPEELEEIDAVARELGFKSDNPDQRDWSRSGA